MFLKNIYRKRGIIQFSGKDAGDLYIQGNTIGIISNVINIEDCIDAQELTTNAKASRWTIPSHVQTSYSSNGWTYGNASSYVRMELNTDLSNKIPLSISFDLTQCTSNALDFVCLGVELYSGSNKIWWGGGTYIQGLVTPINIEFRLYSDRTELFIDDTYISSKSFNYTTDPLKLGTGSSRSATIKNLKIKPL